MKISDGIIDRKRWNDAKRKVLFVLKEPGRAPNEKEAYNSLQELIQVEWRGVARYSFIKLARWAYGIQNASLNGYPAFEEADNPKNRNEAFLSSALMNLKKIPSVNLDRSCSSQELSTYVKDHAKEILEQIKEIAPHVIVCGGLLTYDLLQKTIQPEIKTVMLWSGHPSAISFKSPNGTIIKGARQGYESLMLSYMETISVGKPTK